MAVMSDQEAGRIGGGLVVAGCLATAAGVGWQFGAGWGVVALGAWAIALGVAAVGVAESRRS